MKWNTRVTGLLGCRYPIIEGGLTGMGESNADFAAEVSKTGAVGCITAHSYKTGAKLREAIRRLRDRTDNPFTVNITIGLSHEPDEYIDVCIEERVPCIETAAYKPDAYAEKIKESGITWIHKGATVDFIRHAEALGADAVVLVGLDGYGFKAIRQLPTFTGIAYAARQVKVPLIAAGGIGDGRTMLAALMAGADAVYMGSAFMATRESTFSEKIKENMIKAQPDHPGMIFELVAPPDPEAYTEIMGKRDKMPLNKWLIALEMVMLKRHRHKDADVSVMKEEDIFAAAEKESFSADRPKGPFSFSCAYIDRIPTVKELIDGMVSEAERIMKETVKNWELDGGD
jgi:NAD(P)H-dependent flavin oxidoreductase YrpB (nitropropane dioxygenase family)